MLSKNRHIAYTGMFIAMIAVMSQIAIPMPSGIPVTLQTLAIALIGLFSDKKRSVVTVMLYIVIGASGIPVFSGFTSGFATLFGLTGGFIFGFIPFTLLCSVGGNMKNRYPGMILCISGLLLCHLSGIIQFMIVAKTSFVSSFLTVSLAYIPKDVISCLVAYALYIKMKKVIPVN